MDSISTIQEPQPKHHPSIDGTLASRLKDKKFRSRFIRTWARNEVAMEIRALRKKRELQQTELAKLVGTGQSAISRTEQAEYEGWNFKTLLKLADALDARLRITFEPIENVIQSYEHGESAEVVATTSNIREATIVAGTICGGTFMTSTGGGSSLLTNFTFARPLSGPKSDALALATSEATQPAYTTADAGLVSMAAVI